MRRIQFRQQICIDEILRTPSVVHEPAATASPVRDATAQAPPQATWINLQSNESPKWALPTLRSESLWIGAKPQRGLAEASDLLSMWVTITHFYCSNLTLICTSYFFLPASPDSPNKMHLSNFIVGRNLKVPFSPGLEWWFLETAFAVEIFPLPKQKAINSTNQGGLLGI